MSTVNVTVTRMVTGDIPGPVSLVCDTGSMPYQVTMREVDTGITQVLTLCVDPSINPCDTLGLWDLLASAGWEVIDTGCP